MSSKEENREMGNLHLKILNLNLTIKVCIEVRQLNIQLLSQLWKGDKMVSSPPACGTNTRTPPSTTTSKPHAEATSPVTWIKAQKLKYLKMGFSSRQINLWLDLRCSQERVGIC